jgi:exopolysaccharide biosynthesis predicted pyruvyltransferase EpsI
MLLHSRLADEIDSIVVPLVNGKSEHICIIDAPGHPNVGDSAIFIGEFNFIAKNFPNARLSYYDFATHSSGADRFIEEATIIMMHGGGNFGDIWPDHHALRMKIFERFAHKTIVQFPQSIHFDNAAGLRATAAVIKKQRDFTLLVRDLISFEIAKNELECKVLLSPDMAFAMEPLRRKPATVAASKRNWQGAPKTRSTPCLNRLTIKKCEIDCLCACILQCYRVPQYSS